MKAMKNAAEGEKTPARIALFRHAKTTVKNNQSDINQLRAVFTDLIGQDSRTSNLKWSNLYTQRISVKFFRWLSPGDILDVFVAVKERHSDPNWPGKDYTKVEEVNVELRRRYPQIKDLKNAKKQLRKLEDEEEDEGWLEEAEGELDRDAPRRSVEEAERAYKQSLLSFGASGKRRSDMPDSLFKAGKAFMKAMENAGKVEKTPARNALYQHTKFTVETKQLGIYKLQAVLTELMRKDPRTSHLQWSTTHSLRISEKFVRWLLPGDIFDALLAVKERHSDSNWPGKDHKKLEEVNEELRRKWPQIQNMKNARKRLGKLEEEEDEANVEEDQDEPEPQKKPQRKREPLSGSGNSRDYYRHVTAYLDRAVVRLGKRSKEEEGKSHLLSLLGANSQVFCNEIDFIQVGEVGLMGNELMMEVLKEYRNPETNRVEGFANLGELQSFVKENRIRFEFEATQKKSKKSKIDLEIGPEVEEEEEVEMEVEMEEEKKEKKRKKTDEKKKTKKKKTKKRKMEEKEIVEEYLERAVQQGYAVERLLRDIREGRF
jgi:hypothetical protein